MLDQRTEVAADAAPDGATEGPIDATTLPGDAGVTLHRRRGALALVGAGALVVAAAYTWRAAQGGSPLGWLLAAAMLPIAVFHLAAWWDARVPLLVADGTGLRLRDGRTWTGLRWQDAPTLRLTPARLPRRDGRLVVESADGTALTLPLALVDPADLRELPDALRLLTGGRAEVLVDVRDPAPARASGGRSPRPELGARAGGARLETEPQREPSRHRRPSRSPGRSPRRRRCSGSSRLPRPTPTHPHLRNRRRSAPRCGGSRACSRQFARRRRERWRRGARRGPTWSTSRWPRTRGVTAEPAPVAAAPLGSALPATRADGPHRPAD